MSHLALITGASSGLGKALALLLAQQGISLILTARDEGRLDEVKAQVEKLVQTRCFPCDLQKREELIALIQKKAPDLVINCAGFGLYGPAWSHPVDETLAMIEVNIAALSEITIEAANALKRANKRGTILNVSSAAAFFSYPNFAVYAASKGFVKQFSEALDNEYSAFGIRVLCACPGQIETEFRKRAAKGYPQQKNHQTMSVENAARHIWKQILTGRRIYIFDWRYRLMVFLSTLFPRRLVQHFLRKSIEKRYENTTP